MEFRRLQPDLEILIVDDSPSFRAWMRHFLEALPGVKVVGTAMDGRQALEEVQKKGPGAVLLDLESPRGDSLWALEGLRRDHPDVRVVLLTEAGARAPDGKIPVLDKPTDDHDAQRFERSLQALVEEMRADVPAATRPVVPPGGFGALAIGVSTGGPQTLMRILPELSPGLEVPVFIVQHMPGGFTRSLAETLDRCCPLHVVEAVDGEPARPGHVYIAAGGFHLVVERGLADPVMRLTNDPPEHHCRPAVDVLFRSLPEAYGERILSVILTGMGEDGVAGVRTIRSLGGYCVAQDRATSAVYGMPGAVAREGEADEILPEGEIVPRLNALLRAA